MSIDTMLGLNVALIVHNTLVAIMQTIWYSYWSFNLYNEMNEITHSFEDELIMVIANYISGQ